VSRVDLHVHSNASDGKYTPEEIVARAAGLGLEFLSLTDHDTVDGIAPAIKAAAAFPKLTFIPGVEISTDVPDGEVHVLGYFIDYTSRKLGEALKRFRDSRQGRARGMVDKLHQLGIDIDLSRVREIAGDGTIGRPHIARAMLEKGYITSFVEAFDKYIGRGGPAYVEREKMMPEEAVALVIRSRGLPVMAHPFTAPEPEAIIARLVAAGLVGLEAYYKDYTEEQTAALIEIAGKSGLIATGGSDYHGLDDSREVELGGAAVPRGAAEQLIALAGKKAGE
jgi:predicted metal-dependent phosphoesterase TrpH